MTDSRQLELSYDVKPHPDLEGIPLAGATLAIKGDFRIRRDLNVADELTINIADADGAVIATGIAEVGTPGFKVLTDKGEPVGTIRVHKAALTD